MKKHLAGVKGDVTACKKVLHDIRNQMLRNFNEIDEKRPEPSIPINGVSGEEHTVGDIDCDCQVQSEKEKGVDIIEGGGTRSRPSKGQKANLGKEKG